MPIQRLCVALLAGLNAFPVSPTLARSSGELIVTSVARPEPSEAGVACLLEYDRVRLTTVLRWTEHAVLDPIHVVRLTARYAAHYRRARPMNRLGQTMDPAVQRAQEDDDALLLESLGTVLTTFANDFEDDAHHEYASCLQGYVFDELDKLPPDSEYALTPDRVKDFLSTADE